MARNGNGLVAALTVCLLWVALAWADGQPQSIPDVNSDGETYPYGPMKGRTIAYASYFRTGGPGARFGMESPDDISWIENGSKYEIFQQGDANNVSKWLPAPGNDYSRRDENGPDDMTLPYNATFKSNNSTNFPTRLWYDDKFWPPACKRATMELKRLEARQNLQMNARKGMSVVLKHYGAGFPDADNHNDTVWTYVFVDVAVKGSAMTETFAKRCENWLGELVAAAQVLYFDPNRDHWQAVTINNETVRDENGEELKVPPPPIRGTVGGAKAVKTEDNSTFVLWVIPGESWKDA
ncbi:MAG: hypothetical protein M1832_002424 [Thelocarpon impressellum]|nr:MAG: hypothetical protein M1832_002424 [Thelocarpon impressellum]